MILTAVIILSVLVVILGYTTFNLLRKNEKQEDILAGYMTYLNKISDYIEETGKRIKEIDQKGTFESDDEIGFFFENLKNIQKVLDSFNVKNL
jgi:type II secretory pathway pseudopilin PulG